MKDILIVAGLKLPFSYLSASKFKVRSSFDISFLDVEMRKVSGMDVANHIRQEEQGSTRSIIIFVTGYEKYMNSAFDVSAFHYLLKPINEEKFHIVFGRALKELSAAKGQTKQYILVRNSGAWQKIYIKYYAKMYRLGLIEKKCYQCHSAEIAKEIKRMQFLQEQYFFICKNDVSSVADLIRLQVEAKQTLEDVGNRQKEIYKERFIHKRKCKTTEDFREYQILSMDSANELDKLKAEKKQAKSDIRMISACVSENLYTAFGYVDEMETLDYGAEDVLPTMCDYHKKDIAEELEIVESTNKVVVDTTKTEEDAVGISEDGRVAETVFADTSADNMIEKLTTEQSLYEDFGEELMQSFHNNHIDDDLGYIEAGNSFELPTDTDKREYNTESY